MNSGSVRGMPPAGNEFVLDDQSAGICSALVIKSIKILSRLMSSLASTERSHRKGERGGVLYHAPSKRDSKIPKQQSSSSPSLALRFRYRVPFGTRVGRCIMGQIGRCMIS